ncbi:MAG: TIGR03546 family protein [Sinobacterium sp.]|nr:TIGR03546 family protein [Sinobacterium sp.]
MLDQCLKLFKAINSDASPWQISLGLSLGLLVGFLPLYTSSALVVIFIACVLRINIATFLLSLSFFSGVAWLFDQYILQLGESILNSPSLQAFFTELYQSHFFLFLAFNHTQVMGAWALSLCLLPIVFSVSQFLIIQYRTQFLAWLKTTKAVKWLEMNKWVQRALKASDVAAELN